MNKQFKGAIYRINNKNRQFINAKIILNNYSINANKYKKTLTSSFLS